MTYNPSVQDLLFMGKEKNQDKFFMQKKCTEKLPMSLIVNEFIFKTSSVC